MMRQGRNKERKAATRTTGWGRAAAGAAAPRPRQQAACSARAAASAAAALPCYAARPSGRAACGQWIVARSLGRKDRGRYAATPRALGSLGRGHLLGAALRPLCILLFHHGDRVALGHLPGLPLCRPRGGQGQGQAGAWGWCELATRGPVVPGHTPGHPETERTVPGPGKRVTSRQQPSCTP